jgi:hypothetical protein
MLLACSNSVKIDKLKPTQLKQIIQNTLHNLTLKIKYTTSKDGYILSWKNSPKSKGDYFIIQKCTDEKTYKTLIKYLNTKNRKYHYRDIISTNKQVYYRVISVDTLGKFSFSNTIKILNTINKN